MKNGYTWFWLVAVALGLGVSVYLSSQHYDLPLLEKIEVAQPEVMGETVFKLMRDQGEELPRVLFLGVEPQKIEDLELWRAFILAANLDDKTRIDFIITESALPYLDIIEAQMSLDTKDESEKLAATLSHLVKEKKRVVVLAPNIYTSQLVAENPVSRYIAEYKLPITSLSVVKFPLTPHQSEVFDPPCKVGAGDSRGTGALGCAIRQKAQSLWRVKVKPDHYLGKVEKVGEQDYLVLFNNY